MEQMTSIREQQEKLAKLHFELGADVHRDMDEQQHMDEPPPPLDEAKAQENMTRLVKSLEQLSVSIEELHSSNSDG